MLKSGLGAPWARSSLAVPEKRGRDWESGLLNCLQDPFGGNEAWDRPWSIADFKIEKKLHTAKASSVYSAKEVSTGTPVIMKVYYKDKLSPLNKGQVDRERRIHNALRHPNIVRLFTSFEDEASIYLVMEQATQGDLFMKMCAATQHFSEKTIVSEFLHPLLLALDQLHTLGILHRDIKPENLLVCGDGTLKLADFGLAVDRREERPITRAGTLDYMAPEVLRCPDKTRPEQNKHLVDLEYGTAVDVWAVGILAFELLVGRAPFARDSPRETYDSILAQEPAIPAHLPSAARAFLSATLAKDPNDRPSVVDLLQHPWIQQFERSAPLARADVRVPRLLNKSLSYDVDAPKPAELVGEMSALSCDVLELRGGPGGIHNSMAMAAAAAIQPSAVSASAAQPQPQLRVRPPMLGMPRVMSRSNSRRMLDVSQSQSFGHGSLLASLGTNGLPATGGAAGVPHQPQPPFEPSTSGRAASVADPALPSALSVRASVGSSPAPSRGPGFLAKIFSSPAKGGGEAQPQPQPQPTPQPTPAAFLPRLTNEPSSRALQRNDTFESALSMQRWEGASDAAAVQAASRGARMRMDDAAGAPSAMHLASDPSMHSVASDFVSAMDQEPMTPQAGAAGHARPWLEHQASAHSLYKGDFGPAAPHALQPQPQRLASPQTPVKALPEPLPQEHGMFVPHMPAQPHAPAPPTASASPAAKLGGRARALLTRISSRRLNVAQYAD